MKLIRRSGYQHKLEAMCDKFRSGNVLSKDDFNAVGLKNTGYALITLRDAYELDILSIRRGSAIVGWVLADEIL